MDVSDVIVFLGVIVVILLAIGIGAALALGLVSPLFLLLCFVGLIALVLFGVVIYYLKIYLTAYLARRRAAKLKSEPKKDPKSEGEIQSEPIPDYQSIMEKELAKRCEDFSMKFLLCRIGIDNIKKIEEQHGREVLELFLTEAEKRILKLLKEADKLYRAENDEYVALLEAESTDEWKKRLAEIDRGMRSMFVFDINDTELCIDTSVSLGFAIFPMMSQSPSELLDIAGTQLEMSRDEVHDEELPADAENGDKADGKENLEALVPDDKEAEAEPEKKPEKEESLNLEDLLGDIETVEAKSEETVSEKNSIEIKAEAEPEKKPEERESLNLEDLLGDIETVEAKPEEKSE